MTSFPLIPFKVTPGTKTSHVRITDQLECHPASYTQASGVNSYSYVLGPMWIANLGLDLGLLSTARVLASLGLGYVNNTK